MKKKLLPGFVLFLAAGLLFLINFAVLVLADTGDTVVIKSDGGVDLVQMSSVLAATTTAPSKVPSPAKVVNLTPPRTDNTVHISPTREKDKKVKVEITPNPPVPAVGVNRGQSGPAPAPVQPVQKTVDKVVAEDSVGVPVLTVKSGDKQGLTVQQQQVSVSTNLPLSINTVTHKLSVETPDGKSTKVSVLPMEAVQGMRAVGIFSTDSNPAMTLIQSQNQTQYEISGQKNGRIFGVVPVSVPTTVNLSVDTGKVLRVDRPFIFSLLDPLIK